jgi:hypothetical protein
MGLRGKFKGVRGGESSSQSFPRATQRRSQEAGPRGVTAECRGWSPGLKGRWVEFSNGILKWVERGERRKVIQSDSPIRQSQHKGKSPDSGPREGLKEHDTGRERRRHAQEGQRGAHGAGPCGPCVVRVHISACCLHLHITTKRVAAPSARIRAEDGKKHPRSGRLGRGMLGDREEKGIPKRRQQGQRRAQPNAPVCLLSSFKYHHTAGRCAPLPSRRARGSAVSPIVSRPAPMVYSGECVREKTALMRSCTGWGGGW